MERGGIMRIWQVRDEMGVIDWILALVLGPSNPWLNIIHYNPLHFIQWGCYEVVREHVMCLELEQPTMRNSGSSSLNYNPS